MSTKKVGSTGRYKGRYGVGIKKRVLKVEEKQNKPMVCPFCGFAKISREAAGLFNCKKCGAKFTGGAYEAETLIGRTIKKMVAQKNFATDSAILVKAKDSFEGMEEEVSKSIQKE